MKKKAKQRRMVPEQALPKMVTHRTAKKPPRVGDGSGRWMPRPGNG